MSIQQFFRPETPIIQAPMAGGISTPEFVAAAANAGIIGSFGFAYSTADKIDVDLRAGRALTSGPINANFFVFGPVAAPSASEFDQAVTALRELPLAATLEFASVTAPYYPPLADQLAPIWDHKPELITFHFGIPDQAIIARAQSLGILVGVTATSLAEGHQIAAAGADFIVAQGIEAGGHRGTFEAEADGDEQLTTATVTAQLSAGLKIEIVSAGGVMTAADIATMRRHGATAVQMGTAFLCCDEAGTDPVYRDYLLNKQDRETVLTRGFSGRWARSIETEFTAKMRGQPVLPFPIQNTVTGGLRKHSVASGTGECFSLWAGTGFAKVQALPMATMVKMLAQG